MYNNFQLPQKIASFFGFLTTTIRKGDEAKRNSAIAEQEKRRQEAGKGKREKGEG